MSSETRLTNEKLLKISVSILGLTAIGFLINYNAVSFFSRARWSKRGSGTKLTTRIEDVL